MQIFSTLPIQSSSGNTRERGFTLVELIICIAIIGIVTAIVLVKYSAFDSTVLLKGVAYDIALTLREAQVKSVSVVRNGDDEENSFNFPYGVSFVPAGVSGSNGKTYNVFRYEHPTDYPYYDVGGDAENIGTTTIGRSMRIQDVCYTVGNVEECDIGRLDISFRRPEFTALFYAEGYTGDMENIERVRITLDATSGGTGQFSVIVTKFGQISVVRE